MKRKTTSRQYWLLPHSPKAVSQTVAHVAPLVATYQTYPYAVPPEQVDVVRAGCRVTVPFGRSGRRVAGYCAQVAPGDWEQAHPGLEVDPGAPAIPESLVPLGLWISEYYVCPPGRSLHMLASACGANQTEPTIWYARLRDAADVAMPLTPRRQALLSQLAAGPMAVPELLRRTGAARRILNALARAGCVELYRASIEKPSVDTSGVAPPANEDALTLTPSQATALEAILATLNHFRATLLFGVPGSGKTEVYVRAIRAAQAQCRQAILLVPEIALTTQLVQRLARRFERVATLHSRMPGRERAAALAAMRDGRVDVVIGTRSAVFAPLPRLGLIVVDEEQDSSFKSLASPFFHTRDVAIKRARLAGIPILLGSGTPSLETWHNALSNEHYQLLRLPDRVPGARLPTVQLVATEPGRVLSAPLAAQLQQTIADKSQAILLHNRRGYATHLSCERCGLPVACPRCGAGLVLHRSPAAGDPARNSRARCHRCGVAMPAPQTCLDNTCDGRIVHAGTAIQRLQEEIDRLIPGVRVLRLDRDSMRKRQDYVQALQEFERGSADVLIGTQMIAKGLDFPRVGLVGVIAADFLLTLPDFRATEYCFQLLAQVVGRAGRRFGESLAMVQAHPATFSELRLAAQMRYESFAAQELPLRERFHLPPYSRLVRCVLADRRPGRARGEAQRFAGRLQELAARLHAILRVDPAEPCAIRRRLGLARYQVLIRAPRSMAAGTLLLTARAERGVMPRVEQLRIDVDPIDML